MSFSKEWNDAYKNNTHMSVYPWSDVVSYVMRYVRLLGSDMKVLELGCGAGANIPLFQNLNIQYFAIEGSEVIVKKLKEKFPQYSNSIIVGDFTKELPFIDTFDLIIDRASITHNNTDSIELCLELINKKLTKNGKFMGFDWFSTEHSDYKKRESKEDLYTVVDFKEGQFKGIGKVHFSDKNHIIDLFKNFEIQNLTHKIIKDDFITDHVFASWNIIANKK